MASGSTKYHVVVSANNTTNSTVPFSQQFDLDDAISMPDNNSEILFSQQFDLDDAISMPSGNLLARHQTVIRLVSDMPAVNQSTGNCSICMENFWQSEGSIVSRKVSCGHVYHHNCITDWLLNGNSNSCPLCRNQIYMYWR